MVNIAGVQTAWNETLNCSQLTVELHFEASGTQMQHKQQTTGRAVNIFIILWPGAKHMYNIRQMTVTGISAWNLNVQQQHSVLMFTAVN